MRFEEIDAKDADITLKFSEQDAKDLSALALDGWIEVYGNTDVDFNPERFFLLLGTGIVRLVLMRDDNNKIIGAQVWEDLSDYLYRSKKITMLRSLYMAKEHRAKQKNGLLFVQQGLQYAIDKKATTIGHNLKYGENHYDAIKSIMDACKFKPIGEMYTYQGA
jgi:hypothetical protein